MKNGLKLNVDKTKVVIFGTAQTLMNDYCTFVPKILVDGNVIEFSESAKYLGDVFNLQTKIKLITMLKFSIFDYCIAYNDIIDLPKKSIQDYMRIHRNPYRKVWIYTRIHGDQHRKDRFI